MYIRETKEADLSDILFVESEAFNSRKEAELTKELLVDPSAKPLLSLMAFIDEQPAGHILFTTAHLLSASGKVAVSFLAPLAVLSKFQKQGIGGALIKKGLAHLSKSGIELVFVVGHPAYYLRQGFTPASKLGFETPQPIPEEYANAWMVHALRPNKLGTLSGRVICCDALNKPELWRE
jgi:putative acetyltransferase